MDDPLDLRKRALEDADMRKMLADEARQLLMKADFDVDDDWRVTARWLTQRGSFSLLDALRALEFIQWEDERDAKADEDLQKGR